jgi:phenylacetate-coenzyme A ligase PaaK-like adenylate-forming protein
VAQLALVGAVLARRVGAHRRDRWLPERVHAYRDRRLAALLEHARCRSAFYRSHHRGRSHLPLAELAPLTKDELMSRWDDVVTVPGLTLAATQSYLGDLQRQDRDPGAPWQGRWWVAATAGSSGRRGVFVWDRREWTQVLTSYARVNDWAKVPVGVRHPLRTAMVSSRNPTHQSAVVGASLRSPLVPTLRLDATAPLEATVEALNRFGPRLLVGYASMIGPLARAQLSGTLEIAPERVVAASERLSGADREAARRAWGVPVVDTYAATETAGIASTCVWGSWHVYEDLVIVEPVDARYRAVPDGQTADRVLVTVLFSRTLPLIRYELTDSVRLGTTRCPCGLPYRLLDAVEGRTEDTLTMPATTAGQVRVHPNAFHAALDDYAVRGWQIEQTTAGLVVHVVDPADAMDLTLVADKVRAGLAAQGAAVPPVQVFRRNDMNRTTLGKAPLVRGLRSGPQQPGTDYPPDDR